MDVSQILNLAGWASVSLPEILQHYNATHGVLSHNANNASKMPIREERQNLLSALENMTFQNLTIEERDFLDELDVGKFLGRRGMDFVNSTVSAGDFDPVSATNDFHEAINAINIVIQKLQAAYSSLTELGMNIEPDIVPKNCPIVRVRFKGGTAINDIEQLRKWATEWNLISRGIAAGVGEQPSEIKVIGANSGSIIITLSTTATISILLVIIIRNACRIAAEVLNIANVIEDLRHKRILNNAIEREFKNQQKSLEENGTEDTLEEIMEKLGHHIVQEEKNALRKSITKCLSFYKKGGDVDFIPPRLKSNENEDDHDQSELIDEISVQSKENRLLLDLIQEVNEKKASLLQLTYAMTDPDDVDVPDEEEDGDPDEEEDGDPDEEEDGDPDVE